MKIIIAEKAGYCFGIQNAMAMVENTLETYPGQQIYCLGDISHNRQEMGRLITLGVKKVDTLDAVEDGVVIIRSHGVGRKVITAAEEKALTIVNATCPFVRAMQNKVRDYYEKGYQIVIVGNAEHPEVVGAMGWCDDSGIVLSSGDEVDALPHFKKICVVAQTTIIETKFQRITEALKN
ncbi:MAG: bifunctional 4-hydroxy-3-methylbut-2-enyl diphosphate reductase/30S ribosomal protein S1, partial [Eubacterium aggregans]